MHIYHKKKKKVRQLQTHIFTFFSVFLITLDVIIPLIFI